MEESPTTLAVVQSASSSSSNAADHGPMMVRRQLLLLRCLCHRLGEAGERMDNALHDTKEVSSRLQAQGEKPSSVSRPLADLDGEIARTLAKMNDSRFRHLGMAPALNKLHSMLHMTVNQIKSEANCNNHSSEGSLHKDLLASIDSIAEELHDIAELAERGERAADEVAQARHQLEVLAEDVSDATGQKPMSRRQVPVFPTRPWRERLLRIEEKNAEPLRRRGNVRAMLGEAPAGEPIDVRIPNGDSFAGSVLQEDLHTTVKAIVGSMLEELAQAMDAERLKVLGDGHSNGMPSAAFEQRPSVSLPSAAADRKHLCFKEELFVTGLQDKVNIIEMQVKELGTRVSSLAAGSVKVHANGELAAMGPNLPAMDALTSANGDSNGDVDLGLHDVQSRATELQEHMRGTLSIQEQVAEVEEFVIESSHWATNAAASLLEQLRTATTSFRSEHLRLTQQVTENESQIGEARKELDSLRHELSECMDALKQDLTKAAVETVHKHAEKALDGKVGILRDDVLRDAHELVLSELQKSPTRRAIRSEDYSWDAADALHSVDKLRDEFCVLKNMERLTPGDVHQIVAQQLDELGRSDNHTADLLERVDHLQSELREMKSQGRSSQSDIQQIMVGSAEIEKNLAELQHQFLQLEDSIVSGNAATTREGSLKEIGRLQEDLSSFTKQGAMTTEIEVAGNLRDSLGKTNFQQDMMTLRREIMEMIGPLISERSVLASTAGAAIQRAEAAAKAAVSAEHAALREEFGELKERVVGSKPVATAGVPSAALRAAVAESAAARNEVQELQQALSNIVEVPPARGDLGLCNGTRGSGVVSVQDLAESINPLQEDLRLMRSQFQQLERLVARDAMPIAAVARTSGQGLPEAASSDESCRFLARGSIERAVFANIDKVRSDESALTVLRDDVRKLEAVVRSHEAAVNGFLAGSHSTEITSVVKEAIEESEAVKLDCESLRDSIAGLATVSASASQDSRPPVEGLGNLQDDMQQLSARFSLGGGLITRQEFSEHTSGTQERFATVERTSVALKQDMASLRRDLARYATRKDCEALRSEIAAWSKTSDTEVLRKEQENINSRLRLLTNKLEENDDVAEERFLEMQSELQRYLEEHAPIAANASEPHAKDGEDTITSGSAVASQLDDRRGETGSSEEPKPEGAGGLADTISVQLGSRIDEIERRLTELAEANSEDLAAIHASIEQVSGAVQEESENVEWLNQEMENKFKEFAKDGAVAKPDQGSDLHHELHHEKLKELSPKHSHHGNLTEQVAEISKKIDEVDMWARGEIAILQEGADEMRAILPKSQATIQKSLQEEHQTIDHVKQAQAFDHTMVQDLWDEVRNIQTSINMISSPKSHRQEEPAADVTELKRYSAEIKELSERVEQVEVSVQAANVAELRNHAAELKGLSEKVEQVNIREGDLRSRVAELQENRERVEHSALPAQAADVSDSRSGVAEVKELRERLEQVEVTLQAADVAELRSRVADVDELKEKVRQVALDVESADVVGWAAEVRGMKERMEQVQGTARGEESVETRSGASEDVKELKERVEQVEVSVQDEVENSEWLHEELKNVNQKVTEKLGEFQGFVEQDIQDLKGRIRTLDESLRNNGASNRDSEARISELVRAIRQDQDAEQGAHQRLLTCIDSLCERIQGVEGLVAAANMTTPGEGSASPSAAVPLAAATAESSSAPVPRAVQETLEWAVILEREKGDILGIQMHPTTLVVEDVKSEGLISHWNRLNPEKAVQNGDRVVEVNGKQQVKEAVSECQKSNRLHIVFSRTEERGASSSAAVSPASPKSEDRKKIRQTAPPTIASPASPGSVGSPVAEKKEGTRRIRSRLRRGVNDFLGSQDQA